MEDAEDSPTLNLLMLGRQTSAILGWDAEKPGSPYSPAVGHYLSDLNFRPVDGKSDSPMM